MRAGQLNKRVSIERPGSAQSETGQVVDGWSTVATVWAAIQPLSGRELFAAQQLQARADLLVRIRYLAGVEPKMRVRFGARLLDIQAVRNLDERNRELELFCLEQP